MRTFIKKISKLNFLPDEGNARFPVFSKQFNEFVDIVNNFLGKARGTVTQLTSITTGVTVNAKTGVITTVSSTLAAGSNAAFTVTNSEVEEGSVIMLTVDDSATAGLAKLNVESVADGSFDVNVTNIHGSNAFNNVIKVHFVVL